MDCQVEAEEKDAEQSGEELARKKIGLPPWCIYIAWFLAFVVSFVSSFFVVLYSIEWGYKRSEEWFSAFAMSFFQSAFVVEPAKKLPKENKVRLATARSHREKQIRMNRIIYETLSLLAFVIVLIVVTEVDRDQNAFYLDKSLRGTFVSGMDKVKTAQDFWKWTEAVLLPGVYFNTWYNGAVGTRADRLHLHHSTAYRFQPPRLRQIRIKPGHCVKDDSIKSPKCISEFSWNIQESGDFSAGWRPRDPEDNSTGPWSFRPAYQLKGLPAFGQLSSYPGGGYVSVMGKSKTSTMKKIEVLKNNTWIDRYTRAVMVEFTVYAEGTNLLSSVNLMFELSTTGAFFPHSTIATYRLFNYEGSRGIVVLVFQMLFVTLLVYVAIREFEKAKKLKGKYLQDSWNFLEIATIVGGFVAVVMYGVREAFSQAALTEIKNSRYTDEDVFVNFQHIAYWDAIYHYVVDFVVFINIIKFVRLLRYSRRMCVMVTVLSTMRTEILMFFILLLFLFLSFAQLQHLLLGSHVAGFRSVGQSFVHLFPSLLRRYNLEEILEAEIISVAFFAVFFAASFLMLVNLLLSIMRRAITIVKRQIKLEQSRDLEMAEFIRNNILSWLPLVDKLSPPTPEEGPKYVDQGTSCDLIDLDLDLLAAAELDYVIVKLDQLFPEASRVKASGDCGDSEQDVESVKAEKKVVMVDSCN
ncbi:PREDICTED: polycystic kidney disease 2-like 2 protein [Branchiostoma belcheri]|uniref:Polycystic kidney disease 2-like 2 protein n=1 Tax=Branchiostoma belcheri TaxID=7741 RepID=A0A6P4YGF0_BRABE|nr:PREDICTED: polycystic kidney disease 2-like 2 protein [Branchiostoma belcheri]